MKLGPALAAAFASALMGTAAAAAVTDCGADKLGTARTLTLERKGAAYGRVQYGPLPLAPGEVVLTFDDGPQPGVTEPVLQALAQQCVRASFFMTGEALARAPELGAQVAALGHTVAMHGYKHSHFADLPEAEQLADLKAAQAIHQQVFGTEPAAYRFPFLQETATLKSALKAQGITVMSVDIGIDDWLPEQSPQLLSARLLERLRPTGGGIILMHDAQPQLAAALPMLLQALQRQGYRVVHLAWP